MAPTAVSRLSATSQPDLIAGRSHHDAIERLGVRVARRAAQLGAALAHALFDRREVLELARVAGEGLDLEVHDVADVHHDVRSLPLHDVDLARLVRLVLRHQLGEGEVVARKRIDAVERDAADGAVVTVRGAEVIGAQGILADDEVGAMASDLARDVQPQGARVFDFAVGHDDEGDVLAFLHELRHRTTRAELAVVGVGDDHQDAPDRIAHVLARSHRECVIEIPAFSIPIRARPCAIIPRADGGARTPDRGGRAGSASCRAAAGHGAAWLAGQRAHRRNHAPVVVRRVRGTAHRRRRHRALAPRSMTSLRAVAAWPGPALVATMIAAVAAGAAAAPTLVLAVAVAPLLALVQPPRAPTARHPVTLIIAAAVAALLLWAHLAVVADAATLLGARRWH